MSIQSDIEMLSIEALEYYAKKHQKYQKTMPLIFSTNIKY